MSSEIFEMEFSDGVIEHCGRPICKIRKIQVTKLSQEGIQHIFMDKQYQNSDVNERDEIDADLLKIYENEDTFSVMCYDGGKNGYYNCKFSEKPPKGMSRLSALIL